MINSRHMTNPELRTIGVLGGMSSQSTIEYYRLIDQGINETLGGHNAGEILIRSVNFANIERFIRNGEWTAAGEYLAQAATDLEAGGADFVIMATNTMHKVAPRITDTLSIPFVHILDVTAEKISEQDIENVGVLGTKTTMEGDFYREKFEEHGIDVLVPDEPARETVDAIVFDELTKGTIRDESRKKFLEITDSLVENGANGLVMGCTEIDLLIDQSDRPDLPMFDTTALHVERAIEYSLGETPIEF